MFMNLEILRKIGLSDGEVRIYSALLDGGPSPVNLVHERTGIERRNIYDILNKLIERGLVTYATENRKRFFQISHPSRIIGYIEEKKHDLDSTKTIVEKEIPSIIEKFMARRPKISAEIFRGLAGVKAVWEDMLNYRETYWIGAGRYIPKNFPHFFTGWNKRRVKLRVKWLNLMRYELRKEVKKPLAYEKMKFLPKEFSGNPTVIAVYGNKTVNFLLGDEFFAFVIESKELAENYKRYHRYLWENVAIG